ncbi:2,3-dihydroxyphenylpropionate/2, 3-dihydroxicinnamic acid 1,2-dioxygenase [Pigmentiphaga humi]|uniref:2,3-dihydroxyphenylpropionate/2, 3-dihydroxicinnamic acid 1,2-dioxygenase n=1 Tax=Pigmentiphaga humi TaxID=2478468 RepID=A0A3P4AY59_9BURK|nr:2,3-dihydroxyphenylpropionate 1,2-dioxygenase [Pigmentiphaga humi]VCU68722.1 2,3-dihydroxyphenylpropionate/2, 3-dihydroxicinnamic acid 1,2-dioxygenase [Pigmentiphaga humi]
MARIVSVHAVSHTPVMLNFPGAIPDADREAIFAAFLSVGHAIREAAPEALVVVSDDHLHNFFLDNLPAFCIGAAPSYPTPVEHWLKVDRQVLAGHADLGAHLIGEAMQSGFDPALSMDLTLDHGIIAPLHLAGVAGGIPVVPVLVNCVQPPLPTMLRAHEWGRMLGGAIRRFEGVERVSILATGGLSHDIATPRMGLLNEAFDREFLARLAGGDAEALVRYAAEHVHEAGNGAEEIRTWLIAHGAAGGAPFQTLYYKAVADWYTGIGLGSWKTGCAR